jgi:hypothetical protein
MDLLGVVPTLSNLGCTHEASQERERCQTTTTTNLMIDDELE